MSIGPFVRRVLGDRWFPFAGRAYRALFVDLAKVIDHFPNLDGVDHLLDIGGGDGEVLNVLLQRYPDLHVTMIDLAKHIGGSLRPELRARVTVLPGTSIRDYRARDEAPDVVVVSDVIHHVPPAHRHEFLGDLRDLIAGRAATLVIKEVQPGSLRARLALWSDWYISGDRGAKFLDMEELRKLVADVFPDAVQTRSGLYEADPPNYSVCIRVPGTSTLAS